MKASLLFVVMPAKAGIQGPQTLNLRVRVLDARFRGHDGAVFVRSSGSSK
jgi:hypothetical protein